MAGGNLGDLWFNLSVKSNVRQDLNAIVELLQGLDLKSARTRKELEGIFGAFNKSYAKEYTAGRGCEGECKAERTGEIKGGYYRA